MPLGTCAFPPSLPVPDSLDPARETRLTDVDPSGVRRRLIALLQASPAPTVCIPRPVMEGGDIMLAGSELLERARRRILALDAAGMRPGDVLAASDQGIARVIDPLACLLGGFIYWAVPGISPLLLGPASSDPDAGLLWRPNPTAPDLLASIGPHDPPVVLPHRLPAGLVQLLRSAGPHARVLLDGAVPGVPFAVHLQTLARLGSTLRRRLRVQSQGVRFCAAPGASASGMLLDLLPGLVGRQVVVIPADGAPAPHTIARAIARYRPDNLTLTARQAAVLVASPLDDDARRALAAAHVVVADVHPVPIDLRTTLAALCQRVDVVYVMPEVSDVHVVVREPRDAVR